MGPPRAISECFKKYATFSGRASRAEFWWFNAFVLLAIAVALTGDALLLPEIIFFEIWITPLVYIAYFATLVPLTSVAVRRWHDIGWAGWLPILATGLGLVEFFLPLNEEVTFTTYYWVSMVFALAVLAMAIRPSQPNPNKYGPNPHEVTP